METAVGLSDWCFEARVMVVVRGRRRGCGTETGVLADQRQEQKKKNKQKKTEFPKLRGFCLSKGSLFTGCGSE